MNGHKQYHANPNDHDDVAMALLEKYQDQNGVDQMKFQVQELRPEVLAFALLMEARLREKDADRGGNSWKRASPKNLLVQAQTKMMQMETPGLSPILGARHTVDLANFCMMLADVNGALKTKTYEARDA